MPCLTVISNATHRYTLLLRQTHSDLIQIKLMLKQVTVSDPLGQSHVWLLWERQDRMRHNETGREYCCERQLIFNAARVFGVCMSNASALHRNTITAAHRGNPKWDIKHRGELKNRAQHWTIIDGKTAYLHCTLILVSYSSEFWQHKRWHRT